MSLTLKQVCHVSPGCPHDGWRFPVSRSPDLDGVRIPRCWMCSQLHPIINNSVTPGLVTPLQMQRITHLPSTPLHSATKWLWQCDCQSQCTGHEPKKITLVHSKICWKIRNKKGTHIFDNFCIDGWIVWWQDVTHETHWEQLSINLGICHSTHLIYSGFS